MYQEQLSLVPGGCCKCLALVAYPKSDPHGSPPSLSGAAAWRQLGDVTLTLNQHLEGHQTVFQSPWSMTSRQKLVFTATSFGGLGKAGCMHVMVGWYD